ncbi:MAG: acyl carrier protein [Deltaproteobacteria bacterium]|nr:acyl carrier protein [Deltaproteobacteria bacterium]
MTDRETIVKILFEAIEEVNNLLPDDQKIEKNEASTLFGQSGKLDSMGLVNLIVATEQRIEKELGLNLVLADERAVSQKNSPFRTVSAFIDYISILLEEKGCV